MSDDPIQSLELTSSENPQVVNGITTDRIRTMVECFYNTIQQDTMLGPIFDSIVQDWDAHYEKMTRFWSSAVLRAGTYSGRPIEAHRFGGLTEAHFRHWVSLFSKSCNDVFTEQEASIFIELGKKMASSIAIRIGVGRIYFDNDSSATHHI